MISKRIIALCCVVGLLLLSGCEGIKRNNTGHSTKEIINAACMETPDDVVEMIEKYNCMQDEYEVVLKEYDDADLDVDIYIINDTMRNDLIKNNKLDNLEEIIEKYEDDDYVLNYMNAVFMYRKDGVLYDMVPYYYLIGMIGKEEDIVWRRNKTYEEVVEKTKAESLEGKMYDVSPGELFKVMMSIEFGDEYKDEKSSKNLSELEIKELLDYALVCGCSNEMEDDIRPIYFIDNSIGFLNLPLYEAYYDNVCDITGINVARKYGVALRTDYTLGISSSSDKKEADWNFIKLFWEDEYQSNVDFRKNRLPVSTKVYDDMDIYFMQTQAYKRTDGTMILPFSEEISIKGITEEVGTLNSEQLSKLYDTCVDAESLYINDSDLMEPVLEEANLYFRGKQNLDETAKKIYELITR